MRYITNWKVAQPAAKKDYLVYSGLLLFIDLFDKIGGFRKIFYG
jgi:hypothetical protein